MEQLLVSSYLTHLLLRFQHAEMDLGDSLRNGKGVVSARARVARAAADLSSAMERLSHRGVGLRVYGLRNSSTWDEVARVGRIGATGVLDYRSTGSRKISHCDLMQAERIEAAGAP